MKICILEDDKAQAERMAQYLDRYHREHADFSYELERYARAFDLLEDYRGDADLLFLDIRLPDQLGIETARRIREKDARVMIVFVTNLAQYAIEGYSVQAFDYILKPVDYFAFSVKLERALRALSARADGPVLDIKTREGLLRRIPAGSILYIEVQAHDVFLHTGTEVIRQWGTLSRYEELLQGAHFARCSTSCLVNLKYVRTVQKDRVLVGQDSLTVTRTRRKEFLQALAQYKGGTP
ncbi:response regulator transcription factor [Subdoligranulum sp. DSM 109015]|uniref:Stage 0 sporulation protein A homolog n=1 Tax=Gemmiger gallinarum TaxID=2779354 RepID=A0ABR9R494_9FIRM|nr:LytTR family DNA-binding domain-containing protein [Gemmiger gallinarum]MBE5037970.1 response regulator transcription factor [Gemmiger gallinarum]